MNPELFDHLKAFSTNPYLFIGSGFSRRYINLPTWEELLSNFFEKSKIEGDFEYYKSKSNGNMAALATILSQEFHEVWWKNSEFKVNRTQHKTLASTGVNQPFKIELCEYLKSIKSVNSK